VFRVRVSANEPYQDYRGLPSYVPFAAVESNDVYSRVCPETPFPRALAASALSSKNAAPVLEGAKSSIASKTVVMDCDGPTVASRDQKKLGWHTFRQLQYAATTGVAVIFQHVVPEK
jgi:hypothetical protein